MILQTQIPVSPEITLSGIYPHESEAIAAIANDFDVARYLREVFPHPYTTEDARAFLTIMNADNSQLVMGIRYNGEIAGITGAVFSAGLFRDNFEIGFWLGKKFWNRKILSAVLPLFNTFLFTNYPVRRLYAGVLEGNIASKKVLEKTHFRQEGFFKDAATNRGEVMSYYVYALLREEWEQRQS